MSKYIDYQLNSNYNNLLRCLTILTVGAILEFS